MNYKLNADKINELATERGLSLVQAANEAKVDYFAMRRAMNGEPVRASMIAKLAKFFEVDFAELVVAE